MIEIDYKTLGIMVLAITICIGVGELSKKDDYIQNLEEKLNIYRESYEEFCLEDSLRQVE